MSESTDVRRAMARDVLEQQRREDRQVKAISRSAKVDLDKLGSAPAAQRPPRSERNER